jgi:pimeloyl-ACP methyl ester carboxylesterase
MIELTLSPFFLMKPRFQTINTMSAEALSEHRQSCDIFYVGGRYIKDNEGTHMTGQMCVRRYGTRTAGQPSIVFVHGAAQTGTHFEATPDGRSGLAPILAGAGWQCFVVDQPGIGRSRYHSKDLGELKHYTVEMLQEVFTAPTQDSFPWAELHTQ